MNNNITEDYVSFETAKLLKEKGFNVHCSSFYYNSKKVITALGNYNYEDQDENEPHYSRPTQALAVKWIRENFGLHIFTDFGIGWEVFTIPCGYSGKASLKETHWNKNGFNTPEEGIEAALIYTLKNLI